MLKGAGKFAESRILV